MTPDKRFHYRGRRADGGNVADVVFAPDRHQAILRLEQDGVTTLALRESQPNKPQKPTGAHAETATDRLFVLQQIAVLARAGIPILDSVESISAALKGRAIAQRLTGVGAALRRGEGIAAAFQSALSGYPPHIYALIRVGEANGNLAVVLEEAVQQLRYQQSLRRDISSALTYPAFLACAALCAMAFLFMVVVPRFSIMIGADRSKIDGLSRFVLDVGALVHANPMLALSALIASGYAIALCVITQDGRRRALHLLSRWPLVGDHIAAIQRAEWARVMALAVSSGVGILDAAALSFDAISPGRFREKLTGSIRALRRGDAVADAFGASNALDAIDMSLLRTGQTSGKLGAMLTVIADRHEDDVRISMKRMTGLIEHIAIALVALVIGTVVIGLVGAMTSIYETIE